MSDKTEENREKERQAFAEKVNEYGAYAERVWKHYYALAKRWTFYKSCFLAVVFVAALVVIVLGAGTVWLWVGLIGLVPVNVLGNSLFGARVASCWSWGGMWSAMEPQLGYLRWFVGPADPDSEDLEAWTANSERLRAKLRRLDEQMEVLRSHAKRDPEDPDLIEVASLYPHPRLPESRGEDEMGENEQGRRSVEWRLSQDEYPIFGIVAVGLAAVAALGLMTVLMAAGPFKGWAGPVGVVAADRLADLSLVIRPTGEDTSESGPLTQSESPVVSAEVRTWSEIIAAWTEAADESGGDIDGWMRSQGIARSLTEEMERAVGLFKSSALLPEVQQMAVLHGWVDDFAVCDEIARFLEQDEPGRYACNFLANVDAEDGRIPMERP